ncbi:MAG: hypothetical protein P8179_24035, partial [Candidatus Thiodiazotropha sp.]
VQVAPHAKDVVSNLVCDALLIDDESKNDTYPYVEIPMRVMRVVGIEADQIITINCISPTGTPLKLTTPKDKCSEAISEQFNLK